MRLFLALAATAMLASSTPELADAIHVSKSTHTMRLLREGRVLRRYFVALGGNPVGHKQREGDKRTPEGHYTISGRNPKSSYHLSLRISYPNDADVEHARRAGVSPGGDIMIHGLPNRLPDLGASHRLDDWTDGCIAVTNEEIEEIWRLVPDGTPIQIDP